MFIKYLPEATSRPNLVALPVTNQELGSRGDTLGTRASNKIKRPKILHFTFFLLFIFFEALSLGVGGGTFFALQPK